MDPISSIFALLVEDDRSPLDIELWDTSRALVCVLLTAIETSVGFKEFEENDASPGDVSLLGTPDSLDCTTVEDSFPA